MAMERWKDPRNLREKADRSESRSMLGCAEESGDWNCSKVLP